MPQLVWEPSDFLETLGISPEAGEYETSHKYVISQLPVMLEITLWQYDGDVQLHLFVSPFKDPVMRYSMLECPGARALSDNRGRFIEFAAANTFTGRYDGYSVIPYALRVWVEPQICLESFATPPNKALQRTRINAGCLSWRPVRADELSR